MTAATFTPAGSRHRGVTVLLWVVTILLALIMILAGSGKFRSNVWQLLFAGWGFPIWFSYLIGALEIIGGACLLVPRLASYAAVLLCTILGGAVVTLIAHPTPKFSPILPAVYIVLFVLIAVARRRDRWSLRPQ
jgi:putative oxidoreductase